MTDDENRNQYFLARATKRLNRDMKLIISDPIPSIDVALNEDDILDWNFVIHGREGTPYQGGVYHGRLVFPPTFPFGPPKILFLTPNGRFKVNERICFSLSDFHPEEWKPAYSVTAVLRGVYDFMHETTDTIGSIVATHNEREILAQNSIEHNRLNTSFCKFFPQLYTEEKHETNTDAPMEIDSNTEQTISAHPSTENYVEAMETENIRETSPPIQNTFPNFPNTTTPCPLMETSPPIENTSNFPNTTTPCPLMETAPPIENTFPDFPNTTTLNQLIETVPPIENTSPNLPNTTTLCPLMETSPPIENTFPDFPNTWTPCPLMETAPPIENTFPDFPNTTTPNQLIETVPPIENTSPNFPNTTTPCPLMETSPPIENTFPDFPNTRTPSSLVETVPSIEWNKPLDNMDNLPMDSNSSNHSMRSGNRIPFVIRGINVPTGLVGNILPSEKYHTECTTLQRNDKPDPNQITTNPSLGYSFIQNTPTYVEVSNIDCLYNNRSEVIIKTIKTHKDDTTIYPSIAYMHKTGQKAGIEQVEEGNVPYSRPGIGICQIHCYYFGFLMLIIAYALLLLYLLAYLTILK